MSSQPVELASVLQNVVLEGSHYPERSLLASIDGHPVGTLKEYRNLWRFDYAPAWLEAAEGFDLSPWLPRQSSSIIDGSTLRPVQWYFDNLLPEQRQRTRIADESGVPVSDEFGLLAHYGAESAGSLTLLRPGDTLGQAGRIPLSDATLSARIHQIQRHSLGSWTNARMSLAGAQHKLAMIEDHGLYQPIGSQASTDILKPDITDPDYPHSVINEWFIMRLAREMGLVTPDVQRHYVPDPIYLIRRFDRQVNAVGVSRLHAIDGCQLLNLHREAKYPACTISNLTLLIQRCRQKLVARRRMFDWLLFNVLIGNDDAHLKNLSFLVDSDAIDLAPHYDLLSTVVGKTYAYKQAAAQWPQDATVAGDIMGVTHFADMSAGVLIEAGRAMGLPVRAAQQRLFMMATTIQAKAEALYAVVEQENQQWASVAGPALDGEMRLLRTLIHVVIKPMASQLQR